MSAPPCELLQWDTDFFGQRVARVHGHRLDAALLAQIDAWCASNDVDVLYFLADADDPNTTNLAETSGFRLADIRLTLERVISHADASQKVAPQVRPAALADIPDLCAIAADSYTASRFFYDRRFPPQKAAELYEIWIEKSVHGTAGAVLVADTAYGEVGGYITCELKPASEGQIGLVGVAESARGMGIGGLLVGAAISWFARQGAEAVKVITQGRNVGAQRLYQRAGFLTHSVRLWYHRWLSED